MANDPNSGFRAIVLGKGIASENESLAVLWRKSRGAIVWTQIILVAMAALGQLDFSRQMFAYLAECACSAFFAAFLYSSTWRTAYSEVTTFLLGALIVTAIVLMVPAIAQGHAHFIAFDTMLDSAKIALGGNFLPLMALYIIAHFGSAWLSARRTPDTSYTFFIMAVYPASIELLAPPLMFGFVASMLFFGMIDQPSQSALRLFTTSLVLACCLMREGLSYLIPNLRDGGAKYRSLKGW